MLQWRKLLLYSCVWTDLVFAVKGTRHYKRLNTAFQMKCTSKYLKTSIYSISNEMYWYKLLNTTFQIKSTSKYLQTSKYGTAFQKTCISKYLQVTLEFGPTFTIRIVWILSCEHPISFSCFRKKKKNKYMYLKPTWGFFLDSKGNGLNKPDLSHKQIHVLW